MFTGGAELALKVSASQIDKIFEIIVSCKNGAVQAQFMVTLEAMAKVQHILLALNFGVFRLKSLIFLSRPLKG